MINFAVVKNFEFFSEKTPAQTNTFFIYEVMAAQHGLGIRIEFGDEYYSSDITHVFCCDDTVVPQTELSRTIWQQLNEFFAAARKFAFVLPKRGSCLEIKRVFDTGYTTFYNVLRSKYSQPQSLYTIYMYSYVKLRRSARILIHVIQTMDIHQIYV
jgi:hypothetical protein